MVQVIKREIEQPIRDFVKLMERNIKVEGFNMFAAILTLIWAFGGVYAGKKFNLYTHGRIEENLEVFLSFCKSIIFYSILILLCYMNHEVLKDFFIKPTKTSVKGFRKNSKFEMYFFYPAILCGLGGAILSILIKSNVISNDPQGLSIMHVSKETFILDLVGMPLFVFAEEFFNLVALVLIYKSLSNARKYQMPIAVLLTTTLFGVLHIFSWNFNTVLAVAVSHIPVFVFLLYSRNIWFSVMAHLIENIIALSISYNVLLGNTFTVVLELVVLGYYVKSIAKETFDFYIGLLKK